MCLPALKVGVPSQEAASGSVATVVLRSSTEQLLDDLERAVDDGVNTYKARDVHLYTISEL